MILITLIVLAAALVASVVFFLGFIGTAPESFEDSNGFHFGTPDRPAVAPRDNRGVSAR